MTKEYRLEVKEDTLDLCASVVTEILATSGENKVKIEFINEGKTELERHNVTTFIEDLLSYEDEETLTFEIVGG